MGIFDFLKKQQGEILVLTDFAGNIRDVFTGQVNSGDQILFEFYKYYENMSEPQPLLEGNLSLYTVPDLNVVIQSTMTDLPSLLAGNSPLWTRFAPEVYFYYDYNPEDLKSFNVPSSQMSDLIDHKVKEYFDYYRCEIEQYFKNGKDIKRDEDYLIEVQECCDDAIIFFYDEEITPRICDQAAKKNPVCIEFIPQEYITKEMLLGLNINPIPLEVKIDLSQFSDQEIIQLLKKPTLKHHNDQVYNDGYSCLTDSIYSIPKERVTKSLLILLHDLYDQNLGLELAYALTVSGKEISADNAFKAMTYYAYNRFTTEWDPLGDDDEYGQVCGRYYEINRDMTNPSGCFDKEILTIEQWHDLVALDTRLIDYIPVEIVKNEIFANKMISLNSGDKETIKEKTYKEIRSSEYSKPMKNKVQTVCFAKITENSVTETELYRFCKQLSLQGIQTRFSGKGKAGYFLEAVIPVGVYQQFWMNYMKELSQRIRVRKGKIQISPYSLEILDHSGESIVINNLASKFEAIQYLANTVAAGTDMWQLGDRKKAERFTFKFVGEKQIYPIIEDKMRKVWNGTYRNPSDLPAILENSLKIAQKLEDICIVSTGTVCVVCDARPEHEENRDYKTLATLSESTGELLYSFSGMSLYAQNVVETVQNALVNKLQSVNKLKGNMKTQNLSLPKRTSYKM